MGNLLSSILLSARNDRAFELGQAMALPILLITVVIIYFVRKNKKKKGDNILDK